MQEWFKPRPRTRMLLPACDGASNRGVAYVRAHVQAIPTLSNHNQKEKRNRPPRRPGICYWCQNKIARWRVVPEAPWRHHRKGKGMVDSAKHQAVIFQAPRSSHAVNRNYSNRQMGRGCKPRKEEWRQPREGGRTR